MEQTTILQLKNVTKKIGSKTIIDQLSFDVPKGEIFGFLGPNGAGKTTTIRMIVGLMSMTSGEVLVNGINVAKQFEKAMNYIGAIVENPEFYKFLTGYQNLLHYARMVPGLTKHRIHDVVQQVGLQHRIHDKVKTYSLGMRQRLGIAQALLHKPLVLILDEPSNGLDPAGIRELRDHLRRLAKEEGLTVFVSSHLLSEMELMCDRVAIIQSGKLVDIRTLHENHNQAENRLNVHFKVDHPDKAIENIQGQYAEILCEPTADGLRVMLLHEQIAEINALLVQSGIKVSGIQVIAQTLEDQFLEITRGEGIV